MIVQVCNKKIKIIIDFIEEKPTTQMPTFVPGSLSIHKIKWYRTERTGIIWTEHYLMRATF